MNPYKKFGFLVRHYRLHCQLTQKDIAIRMKKSRSWVSGIEHGYHKIILFDAFKLAKSLHVPLRYLTGV